MRLKDSTPKVVVLKRHKMTTIFQIIFEVLSKTVKVI